MEAVPAGFTVPLNVEVKTGRTIDPLVGVWSNQ
jgi:hypothetical protein